MPSILVRLYPETGTSRLHRYRLAKCDIASDTPLTQLEPFSVSVPASVWASQASRAGSEQGTREGWGVIYQGQGWIGGGWQPVTCRTGHAGLRLQTCGAGDFLIAPSGDWIRLHPPAPATVSDLMVEALLGPALILSLAFQGNWCLHASAALWNDRLAVFLGESGAGKSTLVSYLHQQRKAGWQRVADDILPVAEPVLGSSRSRQGSPVALPHFPQPKLPQTAQTVNQELEQLPISAIYLLGNKTGDQCGVSLRPLAGRAAVSALLSQTVAARLMPPELLEKHMEFCAWVAQAVPIRLLNYPHRRSSLPETQVVLAEDLGD